MEAHYLIADAADQIQDTITAIQYFKKVIEQNEHPQVNKVILRVADLLAGQKQFSEAVGYHRLFKAKNPEPENQLAAYSNIIQTFTSANALDSLGAVILEISPLELYSMEDKAKFSRQLSNLYGSDSLQVVQKRKWLDQTIAFDKNEIGADAQYELAMLLAKEGKFKESNDMISTKFKNEFAEASDAVIGKAYVLLADNFVSLKNLPQAKAILKSVIDNSSDSGVIELAKTKLKSLPIK
jgi:predicted negative regulator of RcsB-dependent stress response